jgi:hypothetical protein
MQLLQEVWSILKSAGHCGGTHIRPLGTGWDQWVGGRWCNSTSDTQVRSSRLGSASVTGARPEVLWGVNRVWPRIVTIVGFQEGEL